LLSLAVADQRKRCAIRMSSAIRSSCCAWRLCGSWQTLPGAVETHGLVERWAAFAVGFLLTAAILLVVFW